MTNNTLQTTFFFINYLFVFLLYNVFDGFLMKSFRLRSLIIKIFFFLIAKQHYSFL